MTEGAKRLTQSEQRLRQQQKAVISQRLKAFKDYTEAQIVLIHLQRGSLKEYVEPSKRERLNKREKQLKAAYMHDKRVLKALQEKSQQNAEFIATQQGQIDSLNEATLRIYQRINELLSMKKMNMSADAASAGIIDTTLLISSGGDYVQQHKDALAQRRAHASSLIASSEDLLREEHQVRRLEIETMDLWLRPVDVRAPALKPSKDMTKAKSDTTRVRDSSPPTTAKSTPNFSLGSAGGRRENGQSRSKSPEVTLASDKSDIVDPHRSESTPEGVSAREVTGTPPVPSKTVKSASRPTSGCTTSEASVNKSDAQVEPEHSVDLSLSEVSVETQVDALRVQLKSRRRMAEKLKQEYKRSNYERLDSTRKSLERQIKAYDQFISETQVQIKQAESKSTPQQHTPRLMSLRHETNRPSSPIKSMRGSLAQVLPMKGRKFVEASETAPATKDRMEADAPEPNADTTTLQQERSERLPAPSASGVVGQFSPFGILSLVAGNILEVDDMGALMMALGFFILCSLAGLMLHFFGTLPLLYFLLTRKNPYKFLWHQLPAWVNVLGPSSSSAALPITSKCLTEGNGVDLRVARFCLPMGATINIDGAALYEAMAAVFVAQLHRMEVGIGSIIAIVLTVTLSSVGSSSLPGAGLVSVLPVLAPIPVTAQDVAMLISVDWFIDRIRTCNNVMGDSIGAGIVNHLCRKELRQIYAVDSSANIQHMDTKTADSPA